MSDVRVDESALAAEAAQVAEQFPDSSSPSDVDGQPAAEGSLPAGGASPEQIVEGYRLITLAVIDRGAQVLTPAWTWKPERKSNLATACAQALYLWFGEMPIPPKYMALLIVANAFIEVVDDNRDANGNLKPVRAAAKPAEQATAA